ncbi:MAG: hypothetical protein WBG73_05995 [Coleofasciculaceae cyanobacterium]
MTTTCLVGWKLDHNLRYEQGWLWCELGFWLGTWAWHNRPSLVVETFRRNVSTKSCGVTAKYLVKTKILTRVKILQLQQLFR